MSIIDRQSNSKDAVERVASGWEARYRAINKKIRCYTRKDHKHKEWFFWDLLFLESKMGSVER